MYRLICSVLLDGWEGRATSLALSGRAGGVFATVAVLARGKGVSTGSAQEEASDNTSGSAIRDLLVGR